MGFSTQMGCTVCPTPTIPQLSAPRKRIFSIITKDQRSIVSEPIVCFSIVRRSRTDPPPRPAIVLKKKKTSKHRSELLKNFDRFSFQRFYKPPGTLLRGEISNVDPPTAINHFALLMDLTVRNSSSRMKKKKNIYKFI